MAKKALKIKAKPKSTVRVDIRILPKVRTKKSVIKSGCSVAEGESHFNASK